MTNRGFTAEYQPQECIDNRMRYRVRFRHQRLQLLGRHSFKVGPDEKPRGHQERAQEEHKIPCVKKLKPACGRQAPKIGLRIAAHVMNGLVVP